MLVIYLCHLIYMVSIENENTAVDYLHSFFQLTNIEKNINNKKCIHQHYNR